MTRPLDTTWITLQDPYAEPLAAIRFPDEITLRLAKNFQTARLTAVTLIHFPPIDYDTNDPYEPPEIIRRPGLHARWPLSGSKLILLDRISILAFLAFLSEVLPEAPPPPMQSNSEPEDHVWLAQTLHKHGIRHPGHWLQPNAKVHLRTLADHRIGYDPLVKLSRGRGTWVAHWLTTDARTAPTRATTLKPWPQVQVLRDARDAAEAIEAVEMHLLTLLVERTLRDAPTEATEEALWAIFHRRGPLDQTDPARKRPP